MSEPQDNCHRCHYFLPWVETSRGEINRVCVDEEKRTIERCHHYSEPEKCEKFKPSTL